MLVMSKRPQLPRGATVASRGIDAQPVCWVEAVSKLGTWCPLSGCSFRVLRLQSPGKADGFGPPWDLWPQLQAWDAYLVVHLLRTVEDVHHSAQGSAEVLGGLCLARPSRTSRGSTHDQVEGLGQGHVASARDL